MGGLNSEECIDTLFPCRFFLYVTLWWSGISKLVYLVMLEYVVKIRAGQRWVHRNLSIQGGSIEMKNCHDAFRCSEGNSDWEKRRSPMLSQARHTRENSYGKLDYARYVLTKFFLIWSIKFEIISCQTWRLHQSIQLKKRWFILVNDGINWFDLAGYCVV